MTAPRIIVRYFDASPRGTWSRLVGVLRRSIERHCAGWDPDIETTPPATLYSSSGRQGDVHNTRKLNAWAAAVQDAANGDRILLLDADTLILRSLDDVWDRPFDLAYTTRPAESRYPFNGGVVFLRVSPATKAFVARWQEENLTMLTDAAHHRVWSPAFGGINQSALGMLLTQKAHGLSIARLPCLEWNCEDECWANFSPDRTRIVHYKGGLQRALFNRQPVEPSMEPLIALWLDQERDAEADDATPNDDVEPTPPAILPHEIDDQMIRPVDVQTPVMPPLTRRQRRRAERPRTTIGHAP